MIRSNAATATREKGPGVESIVESSTSRNPVPASRESNSDTQSQKTCRRCGEARPRDQFRSEPRNYDALGSWCKPCALDRTQQWRREHRERLNARRRDQYAADHVGPVRPYARPAIRPIAVFIGQVRGAGQSAQAAHPPGCHRMPGAARDIDDPIVRAAPEMFADLDGRSVVTLRHTATP